MEEHVFDPQKPQQGAQPAQQPPPHREYDDEEDNTELIQTIIRLVIGLVIVIAFGLVGVYAYISYRNTMENAQTTPTPTPSPTSTVQPTQKPLNMTQPVPPDWKTHEDRIYRFSIQIPKNWEVFKRAGDESAYQLGARPLGAADVPVTITLQPNAQNQTLDQWVSDIYGTSYPRTKGKIAGKDSLFVKNEAQNYVSYYIIHNGKVYEFSASVVNTEYYNVFEKIIASLKFN